MIWLRARFVTEAEDFRPIYDIDKEPNGPIWRCTGYTGEKLNAVIVAFVRSEKELKRYWPEAKDIEFTNVKEPTFSDRFPKPDWYDDQKATNEK